jgi:dienelactone hydrolase
MHLSARPVFIRFALVALLVSSARSAQAQRHTGPWDVEALKVVPAATWGEPQGVLQEVYYEGEPIAGRPTRVWGYYARPAAGDGPFPAMVLVHGGGGTAFAEWATLWAERGYCALAMDLAGCGPNREKLPDGGPDQSDDVKFRPFADEEVREMWTYHAVAAVVRGHSLLASRPEVDRDRIGITGISWGGYLTCIVAGIDDRLKVAVPVYGCGFLHEDSVWLDRFAALDEEHRARWVEQFDPSRYLPGVSCPILFVNGTNDFAYPMGSYRKSYRLVPGPIDLSVIVRLPHGHPEGWAPREIGLYVDSVLTGGETLARLAPPELTDGAATTAVTTVRPIAQAQLHWTTDTGKWQDRNWQSADASHADGHVAAPLPQDRPLVYYFTVTDDRGATTSCEHAEVE